MSVVVDLVNKMPFIGHLILSFGIRAALIGYGDVLDGTSEVPYTDVDYRVVTDGAQYIMNGTSPYLRHTYRYSPLLAIAVLPNLWLNKNFGKLLFATFDLLIGMLIKSIVCNEYKRTFMANSRVVIDRINASKGNKRTLEEKILEPTINTGNLSDKYEKIAVLSACFWLYNPLTMVIGTRGNGDALSSFIVLATVYFFQLPNGSGVQYLIAGLFHGLAIHLRLYPLLFSLAYFLSLNAAPIKSALHFIVSVLRPNRKQLLFIAGTLFSLTSITGYFYHKYGWEFLYETYIYHLERKDTRHNFSLYFYMQYLSSTLEASTSTGSGLLDKILVTAPPILIIVVLSFAFGRNFKTLPFCLFAQTFFMVTYNSVVTSQYFIWFLSLLPLCAKNLKRIGYKAAIAYLVLWFMAQGGWLLPAYFLEFKGWNTFDWIWIQSLFFFSTNIFILQRLIANFDVLCDFNAFFGNSNLAATHNHKAKKAL